MKLASVSWRNRWRTGVVQDDVVAVLDETIGSVDDVVRGVVSLESLASAVDAADRAPRAEVVFGPPLRRFNRDILCTGWNFWSHFEESAGRRQGQDPEERPEHPTFFTKGPQTVIGPYDDISFDDALSQQWDYEAELAVVIGRAGRSIQVEDAQSHIFGYVVVNDVSARDLQRAHGGQWLKGKSIDETMPIGPWITTADEVADVGELRIRCELNGELLQDAAVAHMAFSIPELIAELSRGMTLQPGDVVLTGTPSGVGNGRDPQVFLAENDVLVTSVTGLGELRNRVTKKALV
jgi:2-keto-4-pentenoate hydratase/2-oxohepta-3-ene-1,7-dioic acid hydratase in catechol pathway